MHPLFLGKIMKKIFLSVFFILCVMQAKALAADFDAVLDVSQEERILKLKEYILAGDYSEGLGALKQSILDERLPAEERFAVLEKVYYIFKDLGKYKEAGEILELAYLITPANEKVLQKTHAELVRFYRTVRKWTKCIDAHFYYLEHVKLTADEKKAVLFEIIDDYQKNRAFEQANHVLDEVFNLCETKQDFAHLYYYHAQSEFNQNNYQKAIELYKKALAEEALDENRRANSLYQLGFCHEILHKEDDALYYYERALPLSKHAFVIERRIEKLQAKKKQ